MILAPLMAELAMQAQRERRAARMEAQAACMRAELAQLSGDGTRRLWPGIPSTIQR